MIKIALASLFATAIGSIGLWLFFRRDWDASVAVVSRDGRRYVLPKKMARDYAERFFGAGR